MVKNTLPIPGTVGRLAGVLALLVLASGTTRAPAQSVPKKDGLFITVPIPITDGGVHQIQRKVEQAIERRKKLAEKIAADFTIIFDFNPNGLPNGTSPFGSCHDLAVFIRNLRLGQAVSGLASIRTIAFVHNVVSKHAVLPVLACGDLVMSEEKDQHNRYKAKIGDVQSGPGKLSPSIRQAYEDLTSSYPRLLVFRLIDRDMEVRKVKTQQGTEFLTPEEVQKRREADKALVDETPPELEAGNTMLDADQARKAGLCSGLFRTRADLARFLGLPHSSLHEVLRGDRTTVAWRIEVRGILDSAKIESLRRRIKYAVARNANLIILHLDSEKGATVDAAAMAQELIELKDDRGNLPVETIAYIPRDRKLGAATFLALGCNEIVMAKTAVLGDFNYLKDKSPETLKNKREMLVKLAKDQGYPHLLFEAMLDPQLELYRVRSRNDPNDYRLVTEADLKADQESAKPRWHEAGRIVKGEGQFLTLDADLAKKEKVVRYNDVDTLEALYALESLDAGKIHVSRDDWLDKVAEFFREPIVNVILIMLGIVGLILELKMPGIGLPGILSALCFVLFFWAYSFVGEFTLLAVLLFVLGLILIGLEVFVLPGFGITGISGIVLVVASLVLVTLEKMPETTADWLNLGGTLATFGLSLMGALAAAFVLAWYLPHIPYANRLVLSPPTEPADATGSGSEDQPHAALLGAIGIAETTLRPAGKARFGDDFHDVIAEGDYIPPGTRVQVIEIEGNRIVVKGI